VGFVRQLFASEHLGLALLWTPVDFSGRMQRSGKPRHERVWAGDSAQTHLESGGGGIRTSIRLTTDNGFRDRYESGDLQDF
jgi:hypothetical protein